MISRTAISRAAALTTRRSAPKIAGRVPLTAESRHHHRPYSSEADAAKPIPDPQPFPSQPPPPASSSSNPASTPPTTAAGPATEANSNKSTKKFRAFRPLRAAMTLSPAAVAQLRRMLDQPKPQLIKVGVKQKGCSGLSYDLKYVENPERLDEVVEQDGVRIVIDNRALMSVIGSEMDWVEDVLSKRFVFRNPNIKQSCGCGESFMV